MISKELKIKIAAEIVDEITEDLLDRSGLQNAMEEIGEDTRDEIRAYWMDIVIEALSMVKP